MTELIINEEYKKTRYIFIILLTGQIIFFFLSLLIVDSKMVQANSKLDDVFRILIPLLGITAMFLANKIYNYRVAKILIDERIEDKLDKYRSNKIVQWALIDGIGFLAIISFIITSNYLYTIIFLFLIGYFYLLKPTKAQLKSDMKI